MKRLRFYEWIPLIGQLPFIFGGWRQKAKYLVYPECWFYWHMALSALGLFIGIAFVLAVVLHVLP